MGNEGFTTHRIPEMMLQEEDIRVYQIDDLHDEDIDHLPSKRYVTRYHRLYT